MKSILEINKGLSRIISTMVLGYVVLLGGLQHVTHAASIAPYPASSVIQQINWDFSNLIRLATGSDIWTNTWASDGNVYAGWGDGGGFQGDNTNGRVSLGFARITGMPPGITGTNVWGAYPTYAENPATFCGKPGGMLSVYGVLYAWIGSWYNNTSNDFFQCPSPNPDPVETRLAWSSDLGATWQLSSWYFTETTGSMVLPNFINFGQDYAGARDGYIYLYGHISGDTTHAYLARVLPANILNDPTDPNQTSYEFFTGLDAQGNPSWSINESLANPVFTDPNGVSTGFLVVYNSALQRYIATTSHGGQVGQLGVFDAPEPWGPWTTVAYYDNWGGFGTGGELGYNFSNKWTSSDGLTMWMDFSAGGLDSFNLVKATLTLTPTPTPTPSPLVISSITVSNITSTSATISWTTNRPSTSLVKYGKTTSYNLTASNNTMVTSHSISLSKLSPRTTYHYQVASTDASGATVSSQDQTFTTQKK